MPLPLDLMLKARSASRRSLGPAGSIFSQEKSISRHRLLRPRSRQALRQPVVERFDDHPVHVHQADEAQGRRHLLGKVQLGRRAEIHGQAVVDQDVKVQVLLFHEQADEQAVEPGEEVPVEEAQVVADDVIAVVGELDALPLALAAPFALHPAEEDLARHQLELFETGQELRIEQRLRGMMDSDLVRFSSPGSTCQTPVVGRLFLDLFQDVASAPCRPGCSPPGPRN